MATRKRTTRAAGARKSTAKKSSAKKASAKKPAAKKTPSRKSAAKKSTEKSTSQRGKRAVGAAGAKAPKLAAYRRKRDFAKTAEPSGDRLVQSRSKLRFVVQKHAASHLHFDWRLELDGVMKSWAVPKGPSLVPGVRRLAMEVEDHPIAYNTFEGTIPEGEYGGGTVMLWDRGTYDAADGGGVAALREGYAKGKLDIVMHGERVRGAFTMVRTTGDGERAQWLLIKRTDDAADRDSDIAAEATTSVVTGRTMEQIAEGKRVWRSNRR